MIEEKIGREQLLFLALIGCDHLIVKEADNIKHYDLYGSKEGNEIVGHSAVRHLLYTEYEEEQAKRKEAIL